MSSPSQPSERIGLVATIDPQTVVNSQVYSDVVDMSKWHEVLAILQLGNMAAETIDFTCYTCDSDGSNKTSLKAATQLAAHASNNDNKQVVLQVKAESLPQSKRYITFGAVTGNSTGGPAAVTVLGINPRYGPATDNDLSSVAEIK